MTLAEKAKLRFVLGLGAIPLAAFCWFKAEETGMTAMDTLSEPQYACDAACRQSMKLLEAQSGRWGIVFLIVIVSAMGLVIWAVMTHRRSRMA